MDNQFPFILTQVRNVGTSNPIVRTLVLQFSRILSNNLVELPQEIISSINEQLYGCMNDLLKAEEYKNEYTYTIKRALKTDDLKRISYLPFNQPSDVPIDKLEHLFNSFLIHAVLALRRRENIARLALHTDAQDDKLHKEIRSALKSQAKQIGQEKYDSFIRMLKNDTLWIIRLNQMCLASRKCNKRQKINAAPGMELLPNLGMLQAVALAAEYQ